MLPKLEKNFSHLLEPETETHAAVDAVRWSHYRGRLGNEGRPISLNIGTQSRYVNFCDIPKFQLSRPVSSRVLGISPSGAPKG